MDRRETIERAIRVLQHHPDFVFGDRDKISVPEIVELLKEQEPVKPVFSRVYDHDIRIFACGVCGKEISAWGFANYCQHCGRPVKWE